MTELLAQFGEVMCEVFEDDELTITRETTASDVDGWDSLMHINLIIAVEKKFGIRFATAEISGLKGKGQNVGTFLDLVQDKIQAG